MNAPTTNAWKPNWNQTREAFTRWWNQEGLLVSVRGPAEMRQVGRDDVPPPADIPPGTLYTSPKLLAQWRHSQMARRNFLFDTLPIADSSSFDRQYLALLLGSRAEFFDNTSWYHSMPGGEDIAALPEFQFDPECEWQKILEETMHEEKRLANGNYSIGMPSLTENIDILNTLCGTAEVMMEMAADPDLIKRKLRELNQVFFKSHDRLYDLAKMDDGSSFHTVLQLWAPGKVAYLQCDESAMISPEMFIEFVLPGIEEQCEFLDYSAYHLDGVDATRHLDAILSIKKLGAIQWVPGAGKPTGCDPVWFDLYRKILSAGKSVMVVGATLKTARQLLDGIGGNGVYFLWSFEDVVSERDVAELESLVADYRPGGSKG